MHLLGLILRRPLATFVFGVAVLLVSFVLATAVAALRVRQVENRWEQDFGSWEEIAERHPSTGSNGAARKLVLLAARLGIELASKSSDGRHRPSPETAAEFAEIKDELGVYLDRQLERSSPRIDPPPERVAAYLDAHAGDVEAVRGQLRSGAEPRWELRLEMLSEVELPGLLGHLFLQRVLLADALIRERGRDHDTALADLDGSWKLNAAIRDDPILVTQLVAISVARRQAGTLRQLEQAPTSWKDRLFEHDFRRSLLEALGYEGRMWIRLDEAPELRDAANGGQRLFWAGLSPYLRFSLADASERYRRRLRNLAAMKAPCDKDLRGTAADLNPPVPRWNVLGRILMPDYTDLPARLARLELDLELTARIVEARAVRRESKGRRPGETSGIAPSVACPEDHWVYDVGPDGTVSIAFSREMVWPADKGVVLPMHYTGARSPLDRTIPQRQLARSWRP